MKWDLATGEKLASFFKIRPASDRKGKGKATQDASVKGHTDQVLSLALSGDGKFLASAGRDKRLCVWDVEKGEYVKTFSGHLGHKDAIVVCVIVFFQCVNRSKTSIECRLPQRDKSAIFWLF